MLERIETERLILREFEIEDIDDIYEFAKDELVTKYLYWDAHKSKEESLEVYKNIYRGKTRAIYLKSCKKVIGAIELRRDLDNRSGELGYVLNSKYWNKGYMSEACMAIIDYYFLNTNINRIQSFHLTKNVASGKVMEKCNMKYEGELRESVYKDGIFYSNIVRSILRTDWEKNR